MNKNQNIRFNMVKESDIKAWESLHSNEVGEKFKSKNQFFIDAATYYIENYGQEELTQPKKKKTPQYVSTEDMDAIEERIR